MLCLDFENKTRRHIIVIFALKVLNCCQRYKKSVLVFTKVNNKCLYIVCISYTCTNMSNINKNKDIDGNKAEETRSSAVDQILDVDANIRQIERNTTKDNEKMDSKLDNTHNFQHDEHHSSTGNEKRGASSSLTRSRSSSDLQIVAEEAADHAATTSKQNDRYSKVSKSTNRKYSKRLSQKHYHTMQISYPIDEPSALLPIDVDPPFDGESEMDMHTQYKAAKVKKDIDNLNNIEVSSETPDIIPEHSNKTNSSNRSKSGARLKERITDSIKYKETKEPSLPPDHNLGAVGGLPTLATSSSSSCSRSTSNEASPSSSLAASPEMKKSETNSFFPLRHQDNSKNTPFKASKSLRSKSEDAKSGRNKYSSKVREQINSTSSSLPLRASIPDQISHSTRRILAMEDQRNLDWQTTKSRLTERSAHVLESGLWADCEFHVGLPPNIKIFHAHKMFLAMASPVFEAMFFGGFSTATDKDPVKILDVQPDAFKVMLDYIYTDRIHLTSFELVCDICYAAKKYMLPALVEDCTKYLWRDLYPRNACRAYEFAKLFEEQVLMEKGLQIIQTQTKEILSETTFDDVEHSTLCVILSLDEINVDEATLFEAMVRWSVKECERRGLEPTGEKKRTVLSEALFLIRYLTFPPAEFAAGPATSELLSQEESFAILMNISAPGSWDLPDYLCKERDTRKTPQELLPAASVVDTSYKFWCKRAMMQEPHCLNTSILDCSVTFMVDRDICIHGIEVPSQASEPPRQQQISAAAAAAPQQQVQENGAEQEVPQLPNNILISPPNNNNNNINNHANAGGNNNGGNNSNYNAGNEYNELLYAHLLDAEGNRLTYTHFTAKVARDSMIEIAFNRSVYIKANKVYRVGMVLNKVGWYPMGVCTRRVNCEGCFFTFCVGQPTDTLRDGLIRSIIFSK